MRELFSHEIEQYLKRIKIPVRISFFNNENWPMVISIWFLYEDGKIKCATNEDAKIVKYLKREPRCGFEIAADIPPYCGVRGTATASIHKETGLNTLKLLLDRYLGGQESSLAKLLLKKGKSEVTIELKPKKIFIWNFSERMQDVVAEKRSLPCP